MKMTERKEANFTEREERERDYEQAWELVLCLHKTE